MEIKLFKKSDIIVIACLVLAAAFIFLLGTGEGGNLTAVITADGEEYARISLSSLTEETELIVNGVTVVLGNNYAYIKDSDCKNQICVKTGMLTKTGQSAACVPNGVAIYIAGSGEVDAVSY
ncbi:MAG: NusG domain II-containing protein [Clostridiales bacterium]|nr:NusG domain II-containing protein [Clostridiales bacterium]